MKNNLIVSLIMVVAVAFLLLSLILGWFEKRNNTENEEPVSNSNELKSETTQFEVEVESDHVSDSIYLEELTESDELLSKGYVYSSKELQKAQDTALVYIEKIHSYDANSPTKQFDNAKSYMYLDFYESLKKHIGTNSNWEGIYEVTGIKKRAVKKVEVVEDEAPFPYGLFVNVRVISEVTNNNNQTYETTNIYNIHFEKNIGGEYKVGSIALFK